MEKIRQTRVQKIVYVLVFLLLLTPLVFYPPLLRSLQTAKFLYFTFFVEVTCLFAVSMFRVEKKFARLKHPVFLLFTAYIFWVIISSALGVDFLNSFFGNAIRLGGWFLLFHIWLFVAILTLTLDAKHLKKAEHVFLSVATVVAAYAILERLHILPSFQKSHMPRASSLAGNPIFLSGFLMLPFALAWFRSIGAQNKMRILYAAAAILMFGGIFVSGTRGALLGLLIGIGVGWIVWIIKSAHKKRNIFITLGACVLVVELFFALRITTDPSSRLYRYTHIDASATNRFGYWEIAWKGFLARPIKGYGYENYYKAAEMYFLPGLYEEEGVFIDKPHNAYFEILVTSGGVGLLLYLCMLAWLMREIIKAHIPKEQSVLLVAGLVAFAVQNAFVFDTIPTLFAFGFFLVWMKQFETAVHDDAELFVMRSQTQRIIALFFSVVFIGFMFIKFFIPSFQFFAILKDVYNAESPNKSFSRLEDHKKLSFVYDHFALAKLYEASAQRMMIFQTFDESIFTSLIRGGFDVYQIAAREHANRGEIWFRLASTGVISELAYNAVSHDVVTQAVSESIRLAPSRVEPFMAHAYKLELDGKVSEAIQVLEETQKRVPISAKLFWGLAGMYYKSGQIDKAADFGYRAMLEKALVKASKDFLWIADYYAQKNDFKKVIHLYEEAVSIEPNNTSLLPNLAAAYFEDGQIENAKKIAERIQKTK